MLSEVSPVHMPKAIVIWPLLSSPLPLGSITPIHLWLVLGPICPALLYTCAPCGHISKLLEWGNLISGKPSLNPNSQLAYVPPLDFTAPTPLFVTELTCWAAVSLYVFDTSIRLTFLNLSTFDNLGWLILHCGCCPMHCRMFI